MISPNKGGQGPDLHTVQLPGGWVGVGGGWGGGGGEVTQYKTGLGSGGCIKWCFD